MDIGAQFLDNDARIRAGMLRQRRLTVPTLDVEHRGRKHFVLCAVEVRDGVCDTWTKTGRWVRVRQDRLRAPFYLQAP